MLDIFKTFETDPIFEYSRDLDILIVIGSKHPSHCYWILYIENASDKCPQYVKIYEEFPWDFNEGSWGKRPLLCTSVLDSEQITGARGEIEYRRGGTLRRKEEIISYRTTLISSCRELVEAVKRSLEEGLFSEITEVLKGHSKVRIGEKGSAVAKVKNESVGVPNDYTFWYTNEYGRNIVGGVCGRWVTAFHEMGPIYHVLSGKDLQMVDQAKHASYYVMVPEEDEGILSICASLSISEITGDEEHIRLYRPYRNCFRDHEDIEISAKVFDPTLLAHPSHEITLDELLRQRYGSHRDYFTALRLQHSEEKAQKTFHEMRMSAWKALLAPLCEDLMGWIERTHTTEVKLERALEWLDKINVLWRNISHFEEDYEFPNWGEITNWALPFNRESSHA